MAKNSAAGKITREEAPGPLRSSLAESARVLGTENGGVVFSRGCDLANAGLDVVLDLENKHGIGNSDRSIPSTTLTLREQRRRNATQSITTEAGSPIARM